MSSDARDGREGSGKSIRGDCTPYGVWSTEYHRLGFLFFFFFMWIFCCFLIHCSFMLFLAILTILYSVLLIILCAYEALDVYSFYPNYRKPCDLTSDGGTHGRDGPVGSFGTAVNRRWKI